jgi:ribonuclease G
MSKELVISANRHETRVALLEDDQLVEVYFQRANEYSLAGSIHKGRVTRVLPGMQSAFVDLGLERDTFLYVSDFMEEHEDIDRVTGEERGGREGGRGDRGRRERGARPPAGAGPEEAATAEPAEGASGETVVAAPAGAEGRREEGRGRRGRRRRGRRGFPESKYATPGADVAAAEPEEASESAEEATLAPLVLPGESLAKYRRAEAAPSAADTTEYDEPVHYPLENAIPDAPVHPHVETKAEVEEEAELERPAVSDFSAPTAEELAAAEAEGRGSRDIQPLDEEEDRDIQEMIFDSLGERPGADAEAMQELAERGEELPVEKTAGDAIDAEQASAEASPKAPEGEITSGAAAVREPGERFPHRLSRRGRRRRGGNRGGAAEPVAAATVQPGGEEEAAAEETTEPAAPAPEKPRNVSGPARTTPSITDLLKQGQEIIVQIAKEPLGQKGARITSHVALPGRFVVYMPTLEHMGVSRRISSEEERLRLKRILQARRPGPVGGFITRTAAEGRSEDEIAADMEFLYNLWQDIKAKADKKRAPALLHHDLDIVQRVLRDQLAEDFKAIWIDNEETYENVLSFVERFQPSLVSKVKLYTREAPIFDAFGITQELEKALRPKVWLKSGGYIVINQTEALVAIDVNTGKFVGKSNRLEDTIVKTNMEAIKEIVRQIRLRDLGGIIVIDFIDMDERKNRQKVMAALEEAMRADRAPYKILQFNDFGLVAITRKRVKQSLERTLCSPCPHCEGAGYVKSVQTVIGEILTEARKLAGSIEGKEVMLRVHPDVAKVIKSHQNKYLEELEEILRRPVLVRGDAQLHHEKFDLA